MSTLARVALALTVALLVCLTGRVSRAQIKEPGAHPRYSVELEPHLTLQWIDRPVTKEGFGAGLRASIPIFFNGPVPQINNNMAISFGLDWSHFSFNCQRFGDAALDCSWDTYWIPIVAQWNFFVHPSISVFGEPGFAIVHTVADISGYCDDIPTAPVCAGGTTDSATDLFEPVLYAGARFRLTDSFGILVRLGIPHISLGAGFLL